MLVTCPQTVEPFVEGCALPFGIWRRVPGSGGRQLERFAPGCCADMIRDKRLALRLDHIDDPAFAVTQANGRLRCWEEPGGLMFEARLPSCETTDTLLAAMDAGDVRICCGAGRALAEDVEVKHCNRLAICPATS